MKKMFVFLFVVFTIFSMHAQSLNAFKKDINDKLISNQNTNLSEKDMGEGLREALYKGVRISVDQLSKSGGYFTNADLKILLPDEANNVDESLRKIGQGKLVDDAIVSMNQAAEKAAIEAKILFKKAIQSMTLSDVKGILYGPNDAATRYLERSMRKELEIKFKPIIKTSLDQVGATKNWKVLFTRYNKIPFVKKINPDLVDHVTQKALDGLFIQIAKEELKIRKDPLARSSDLLKKVFAN